MPRACPSSSCRRASRGGYVSTHAAALSFQTRTSAVPESEDGFKSSLSRDDIGPQRLELFGLEEIAPWRHLVLAVRHRIDEAFALIGRKFPQIECRAGLLHARAVTGRTVDRVELGAGRDLIFGEALRFFGAGRHAHNETCQRDRQRNVLHARNFDASSMAAGADITALEMESSPFTPARARRSRPIRLAAPCP